MTSQTDERLRFLFEVSVPDRAPTAEVPAYARVLTPAERRAEETTRVAREITDAEAAKRQADVARLRAARLEKEQAEEAARAEAAAAKAAAPKGRKKKA